MLACPVPDHEISPRAITTPKRDSIVLGTLAIVRFALDMDELLSPLEKLGKIRRRLNNTRHSP